MHHPSPQRSVVAVYELPTEMADKMKTTTSISQDNGRASTSPAAPNSREVELVTHLAAHISEGYRLVKQRQPKLFDLTNQARCNSTADCAAGWHEICSPKNKLKRKKTLSASLTSVSDSVNQEKRTRIEGIQLNCRGRLNIKENPHQEAAQQPLKEKASIPRRPPLPQPLAKGGSNAENQPPKAMPAANPPRMKRRLQENVQTIQKLNALAEQLRLEINELKSSLTTEKGAVRVLRAQNEAETRKWKAEVKKLQQTVELLKKGGPSKRSDHGAANADNSNLPQTAASGLVNYEIQRLTNEVNALKEANKALEEKKAINCDADRRKAADIRELKDSYEIRLTQVQKSAKTEISRLLEEIKTKERNIGQLKKDLQILQNSKKTSRNATTNNTTNKTTTLNSTKKPKNITNNNSSSSNNNNNNNKHDKNKATCICICNCGSINATPLGPDQAKEKLMAPSNGSSEADNNNSSTAESPNKISKLKNIELINNTRNATAHAQRASKVLSSRHEHEGNLPQRAQKQLVALEIPDLDNVMPSGEREKFEPLLTAAAVLPAASAPAAAPPAVAEGTSEISSLPAKKATSAPQEDADFGEQQTKTENLKNLCESSRRHMDLQQSQHHSDSDSALSSAPPSISPQPMAHGMEATDIWQTIRSYTNDIEKCQKEMDSLQQENEKLHQQLAAAKDQITELERAAIENTHNEKCHQLLEHIRQLESQEHQLQAEASELREQNELLEFRILELEDCADKWSLQSNGQDTAADKNVWQCAADQEQPKQNPFEMLFGNSSSSSRRSTTVCAQSDSGITSPQGGQDANEDLLDLTSAELHRRLGDLVRRVSLESDDRQCLQQVQNLLRQLDTLTPRSGPSSFGASASSGDPASIEMVKSRVPDYNLPSSPLANIRINCERKSAAPCSTAVPGRIVATVLPYSSAPSSAHIVPHNTPTDSPRKSRSQHSQSNSLSESGVFVESDFFSESGDNSVCTQTDFEEAAQALGASSPHQSLVLPAHNKTSAPAQPGQQSHPLSEEKRLQFYAERLEALESKVQIYESSGEIQAQRLAERLQKQILLEKEVKELRDRVEFLECENASLEEERCEFEEAENDTRLRLQRLEVELEILSQRNVELEVSREALGAKYKDCHSECLLLRDDLATSETHVRHLEEDKQKAKENFELLKKVLPVLLLYNTACVLTHTRSHGQSERPLIEEMGNQLSAVQNPLAADPTSAGNKVRSDEPDCMEANPCQEKEVIYLKEEVKCLRHQMKELNSRHYAAMESADSHWVDLEREYKEREEQFRTKELCLKQKIQKLQDCLREDARSANEKICQLEEAEQGLKTCLVKVSKEHQKLQEDHQGLLNEFERFKEQHELLREQQKPLVEAVEAEKKRSKSLMDELAFMRKLQHETEVHNKADLDVMRTQVFDLKKEYLHIEVTNGELREEVATLELQVETLQQRLRESDEKLRCLTDEIRTKDEICQKLEKRLERSEGFSLADELGDTPSKRVKRENISDLKTASKGLGSVLRHMEGCKEMLPSQKQFQIVARDVKKLADTLLHGDVAEPEVSKGFPANVQHSPQVSMGSQPDASGGAQVAPSSTGLQPPPQELGPSNASVEAMALGAEGIEGPEGPESPEGPEGYVVTVGMTLMPQMHMPEQMFLTQPQSELGADKTVISEVPSELRKLSQSAPESRALMQSVRCRKGRIKRSNKRRLTRGRVNTLHTRVRHIVSAMNAKLFQDPSDLDLCQSEVLQRNVSYGSFHSLKDDVPELESRTTESVAEHTGSWCSFRSPRDCAVNDHRKNVDVATETDPIIGKMDRLVQVGDDMLSEVQLPEAPAHIACFLTMLRSSLPKCAVDKYAFNRQLYEYWHMDENFRDGLRMLALFAAFKPESDGSTVALDSYEAFVKVLSSLQCLHQLFKPQQHPVLVQIEERINEGLMSLHRRKMESEFYCTVYYPIKRPSSVSALRCPLR